MKRTRSTALSLVMLLVAVMAALPATASNGGRHRSAKSVAEFAGIVTQASAQSLTIRSSNHVDRVVQLTTATQVRIGGQASTVTAIHVGDQVEVHATSASDGSLTAVSIQLEDDASEEIRGVVKEVTASSLTVTTAKGDVTVALTAHACIRWRRTGAGHGHPDRPSRRSGSHAACRRHLRRDPGQDREQGRRD